MFPAFAKRVYDGIEQERHQERMEREDGFKLHLLERAIWMKPDVNTVAEMRAALDHVIKDTGTSNTTTDEMMQFIGQMDKDQLYRIMDRHQGHSAMVNNREWQGENWVENPAGERADMRLAYARREAADGIGTFIDGHQSQTAELVPDA